MSKGKVPGQKYCFNCGKLIDEKAEICVTGCGVRQPGMRGNKNPGIAAVLSFIYPGLGQIYNGQIKRGVTFLIIGGLLVLSMMIFIGFILYPIFWIYNIVDAYKGAENGKTEQENKIL